MKVFNNDKKNNDLRFFILVSFAESLINFRFELIETLLLKGFEVHVVAPSMNVESSIRQKLEKIGVHVHNVPLSRARITPIKDLCYLIKILQLIIFYRPKYFLSYTVKPVIYGSIAAWLGSVDLRYSMITGLGYAFSKGNFYRNVAGISVRILYKFALSKCTKVFFQNPDDRDLFKKLYLISHDIKLVPITNGSGVNLKYFSTTKYPKKLKFLRNSKT